MPSGIAHVKATLTIQLLRSPIRQDASSLASAGKVNYSGSRKSSAFAATVAAQDAAKISCMGVGMNEVEVKMKGPGAGHESAVQRITERRFSNHNISDTTPVPHNGCRARKRRRV